MCPTVYIYHSRKAFDKVWHDGLSYKLKRNGIIGDVLNKKNCQKLIQLMYKLLVILFVIKLYARISILIY